MPSKSRWTQIFSDISGLIYDDFVPFLLGGFHLICIPLKGGGKNDGCFILQIFCDVYTGDMKLAKPEDFRLMMFY